MAQGSGKGEGEKKYTYDKLLNIHKDIKEQETKIKDLERLVKEDPESLRKEAKKYINSLGFPEKPKNDLLKRVEEADYEILPSIALIPYHEKYKALTNEFEEGLEKYTKDVLSSAPDDLKEKYATTVMSSANSKAVDKFAKEGDPVASLHKEFLDRHKNLEALEKNKPGTPEWKKAMDTLYKEFEGKYKQEFEQDGKEELFETFKRLAELSGLVQTTYAESYKEVAENLKKEILKKPGYADKVVQEGFTKAFLYRAIQDNIA